LTVALEMDSGDRVDLQAARGRFVMGVLLACAAAIGCPAKDDDNDGGMTAEGSSGGSDADDGVTPIDPMGPETDGST
jgi:hypothetical protein